MRIANGLAPKQPGDYTCPFCNETFTKLVQLRYHKPNCPGSPDAYTRKTNRWEK